MRHVLNVLCDARANQYKEWKTQHRTDKEWEAMLGKQYAAVRAHMAKSESVQKELVECTALMLAWVEDVMLGRPTKENNNG